MSKRARLAFFARYAATVLLLNLVWEAGQQPLYTLWWTAPFRDVGYAVVHCTAGDVLIAIVSLLIPVVLSGQEWPAQRFAPVAVAAIGLGLGYTAFSEWLNVYVRHSWAYSPWMPILPWAGLGASPLAQWVLVPAAGFASVRGAFRTIPSAAAPRLPI